MTGALVITEDAFAQVLEGEEATVRGLYESISQDPRHDSVALLGEETVDGRTFGRWAMARVSEDGGPDLRLMSNASKGRIVAASPDAHVTPSRRRCWPSCATRSRARPSGSELNRSDPLATGRGSGLPLNHA